MFTTKVSQFDASDAQWGAGVHIEIEPSIKTRHGVVTGINIHENFVAVWFKDGSTMKIVNALVILDKKEVQQ